MLEEKVDVQLYGVDMARIDALIPLYSRPGHEATRDEVVLVVVNAGLEAIEKRIATPPVTRPDPDPAS